MHNSFLIALAFAAIGVVPISTPSALAVTQPQRAATDWVAGFSAISVPDAVRSATWWRTNLGFKTVREGASADGRVHFALLRRGGHLLEIIQRADADPAMPRTDASFRYGIFKLGFVVADLEALAADLRGRGVKFSHDIVRPPDSAVRTFAIYDLDGNVVQFFGP